MEERRIEAIVSVFDATTLTQGDEKLKDEMMSILNKDFGDLFYQSLAICPKIEKITCCVANGMIVHTAFISYNEE